jgi:RimJ/RimL family protein N-acetyltransferase
MAAVSPRDEAAFLAELEESARAPDERGRFVVEADVDGAFVPAGCVAFVQTNRRSRIAHLHGLILDPRLRGRGIARTATRLFTEHLLGELGFHRIELECYGFNERAIAHFSACGFVREGVRRKAYWRHDDWVDGVFFGLVREDLDAAGAPDERPSDR